MADISEHIQAIQLASRGEEVRDSIIAALEDINDQTEIVIDPQISQTSGNPVENRAVYWALNGKQDSLAFDHAPTAGSSNPVTSAGIKTALDGKQDTLTFDSTPTADSTNPVTSGGVRAALDAMPDPYTFDTAPTAGSNNPVTSGGIKTALDGKQDVLTLDSTPTANSTNPVTSGGVAAALADFHPVDTPDWDQGDSTQPDYVKNRPFWRDITRTPIWDGSVRTYNRRFEDFTDNTYCSDTQTGVALLIPGKEYMVTINGDTYTVYASQRNIGNYQYYILNLEDYEIWTWADSGGSLIVRTDSIEDLTVSVVMYEYTYHRIPSAYIDLSQCAPQFLTASQVSTQWSTMMSGCDSTTVLLASHGRVSNSYRYATLEYLFNFVLTQFEEDTLETESQNVVDAINELLGSIAVLEQQTAQITALAQTVSEQSTAIANLRRQVNLLMQGGAQSNLSVEVDENDTFSLTGSSVDVDDGVLVIESAGAGVEDGTLSI